MPHWVFCLSAFLQKVVQIPKKVAVDTLPNDTEDPGENNLETIESVRVKTVCHVSVTKKM